MNKVQSNPIGKLIAWALLLALAFGGTWFGLQALTALPYSGDRGWQDDWGFDSLILEREVQLVECFSSVQALESDDLSYVQRQQLEERVQEIRAAMAAQATAFRYQIRSADGSQVLYSNLSDNETLAQAVNQVYYATFQAGVTTQEEDQEWDNTYFVSGYTLHSNNRWSNSHAYNLWYGDISSDTLDADENSTQTPATVYVIECGVPAVVPDGLEDEFAQAFRQIAFAKANLMPSAAIAIACALLALVCLGCVLWTAGHRADSEAIALTWQDRIFFDLYLLAMLCAGTALFAGIITLGAYLFRSTVYGLTAAQSDLFHLGAALMGAGFMGVVGLTLRTFAVRCKAGTLASGTLTCRVLAWCWRMGKEIFQLCRTFLLAIPFLWRVIAAFLAYFFADLICFTGGSYNSFSAMMWWCLNIAVLLFLCWWSACFRRLRKGSQAIAAGNLNHQIETHRMPHDLRLHAEDLNNISAGMSSAVDEKMKSERFKAELITNVSHDLKTPLTSILNYVNLLKTTQQTDPKAQEYIEVLDRKSQRLKKLTEDLVEASKASTGVLSVSREKIGMGQLIDQALGEWAEKLEARKLTVVSSLPEGETWVYADGRHLWRVIDNLLSNCAKYAMEGTRVYLDLARGHGQVTLSVKNISRDALNVPPERLMERFVRGEESRTTEGSGLGLSIARSLTELQGGVFQLTVDGDLFKATVTLPQAN